MATFKVTGKTESEIEELRSEFYDSLEDWKKETSFEDNYCLAKIPKQPPEYDGPDRYCTLRRVKKVGNSYHCEFHGGAGNGNPENLEKLAPMKHGMHATRDHLIEDFDEKDQALYDWIVEEWPDSYDIPLEDDPQAAYDFHRLAVEVVRAERGRGFLIEEGEITETEKISEDGSIVIDDTGEIVTEKSEHYLAKMMHRQDKKISEIEKELAITRKERQRQDSTDSAVEAIKDFASLGDAFINRDENEYDPDNKPWADKENAEDS